MKRNQNLKIRPISPKFKILYQKARYKVLKGGRSSAKSWAVAEAIIYYMLKYPIRVLCTREIQKSIKESSYRLLVDTINRYDVGNQFHITETGITCTTTGSTVVFQGLKNNPDQIKSMEGIDIAWVEEADRTSQSSLDILIPTIRKDNSQIWFTFNPKLPTDPVYKMFCSGSVPHNTLINHINYTENPHASQTIIDEAERCKEESEERYRHIWLGELMEQGDDILIPYKYIRESLDRIPEIIEQAPLIAGLDLARFGNDKTVLALRRGNVVPKIYAWKGLEGFEIKEKVVSICIQEGVDRIVVDANGLGQYVPADLKQLMPELDVVDHNSNYSPLSNKFANSRAEIWHELRDAIRDGLKLPNDEELEGQLTTMKFKYKSGSEKVILWSKDDLKKEGMPSPDKGDALALTYYRQGSKIDIASIKAKLYG